MSITEKEMKQEFDFMDKDDSGNIETDELMHLFGKIPGVDESIIQKAISSVDKNGDKKLSFEEYKRVREKFGSVKIPSKLTKVAGFFS